MKVVIIFYEKDTVMHYHVLLCTVMYCHALSCSVQYCLAQSPALFYVVLLHYTVHMVTLWLSQALALQLCAWIVLLFEQQHDNF
jgi:hypothetical protein